MKSRKRCAPCSPRRIEPRPSVCSAPKLAAWIEINVPEGLAIFELPVEHRMRCRTVNGLERLNKEIARRTRVATLLPNEESLLRLVTAVIGEIDADWATGKIYLTMKPSN